MPNVKLNTPYTIKEIDIPAMIVARVIYDENEVSFTCHEVFSDVVSNKTADMVKLISSTKKEDIYIGVLQDTCLGHNYFKDNIVLFTGNGEAVPYNEITRKLFDLNLTE